jgi:MFS family permease
LIPVAMVVARRELSARKSAMVIGLLSITSAAGIGLGYPITGLIAQAFDYRVAFWFGAVVVLSVMLVAALVLPPDAKQGTSHLDVVGSLLFAVVLVPLLMVISEGGQWGWVAPRTVGLVVLAVVALLSWVRHELRTEYPLVVLSHLRSRPVWVANLVALIVGMTMYLFVPVIVEFVEIPRSEATASVPRSRWRACACCRCRSARC